MIRQPAHDTGASRLSRRDLLRVGSLGLRSRRLRAALSALGISIGIAAIVGVLGISQSSKTGLLNELGQLGNLISVQPQSTASARNCSATWRRVAPRARRRPISERRSRTEMTMTLAIPTLPTRRATAPRPSSSPLYAPLAATSAFRMSDG